MGLRTKFPPIYRGDRWSKGFTLGPITGFDWSAIVVRCQIRNPAGVLLWDLAEHQGITQEIQGGLLVVALDVPGVVTATWLGTVYGDVEISRSSPQFGPYTPLEFRLEVLGDWTR